MLPRNGVAPTCGPGARMSLPAAHGDRTHSRRLAEAPGRPADASPAPADRPGAGGGPARRLLRSALAPRLARPAPAGRSRVPRLLLHRGYGGRAGRARGRGRADAAVA